MSVLVGFFTPNSVVNNLKIFSCAIFDALMLVVISALSLAFFFNSRDSSIRISSNLKWLIIFPSSSFSLFFSISALTRFTIWLRIFSTTGFRRLFFFKSSKWVSNFRFSISSLVNEAAECLYPASSAAVLYLFSLQQYYTCFLLGRNIFYA